MVVCKIPLSRDALGLKAGQARRATIGYLVYKRSGGGANFTGAAAFGGGVHPCPGEAMERNGAKN